MRQVWETDYFGRLAYGHGLNKAALRVSWQPLNSVMNLNYLRAHRQRMRKFGGRSSASIQSDLEVGTDGVNKVAVMADYNQSSGPAR